MNKEKLVKILIPVVAIVVILESVILIPNLSKKEAGETNERETTDLSTGTEEERLPVADFVFSTETTEMKVGKSYEVVLNLVGRENFAVDAVETYVNYDPELVTVSGLTQGEDLPAKTTLEADDEAGLIKAIFLVPVEERSGYQVGLDEVKEVFSFMVTPRIEGEFSLDLVFGVGEGQLVTVLPETNTGDSLPFNAGMLDINVIK